MIPIRIISTTGRSKEVGINKLRVGVGKECISPPREMLPLEGYQGTLYEEILQDLYVRTIVLDNGERKFLFISLEVGPGPDLKMKKDIEDKYGIAVEDILGVTTHNHSAGIRWKRDSADPKVIAYVDLLCTSVYKAIEGALGNLRPARYGFGEGKSFINVNRDGLFEDGHWMQTQNFEGPSDKTLAALKFEDLQGNLIGAVLNYGCHAVCAFCVKDSDGKVKISGDFPGIACDYIERRYGSGAVVMWTSGAAGDQNPIFSSEGFPRIYETDGYSESVPTPPGTQYMIQRHLGWTHALDAIKTLEAISDMRDTMSIRTTATVVALPGQKTPDGVDKTLAWLITDNFVRRYRPELLVDGRQPPKESRYKMVPEGHSHMPMQFYLFGDVAWVGAAGELYCEIGWKIKDASPFRKTVVVTHTEGDAMFNGGYILSDSAADHDVFQSYSTETYPGRSDGLIVGAMAEMARKICG